MEKTFKTEEEMIHFGEVLSKHMFPNFILTLEGDLAAGKTTFTKGIGKGLGIKRIINSPTFTIVKVYQGDKTLYHFDVYRLEDSDEELGFEEMFEDNGVCVIEWPQFIKDKLPSDRLDIHIKVNEDQSRTFIFEPTNDQYKKVVEAVL